MNKIIFDNLLCDTAPKRAPQKTNRNRMMRKRNDIYIKSLLLMVAVVMSVGNLWAEGSRDLYPSGVEGGRATLFSGVISTINMPFPTRGTHYVYAKTGETIALASSAQWNSYTTGRTTYYQGDLIRLYDPTGNLINLDYGSSSSQRGRINNRDAELAGPRLPNQSSGDNRYLAIYHTVTETGIYRVEFDGTRRDNESISNGRATDLMANSNWNQNSNSNYIWAWDVSVANTAKDDWISGRVYTNVMNMDNALSSFTGSNSNNPNGFFGKFKVLTRDGYVYNVDNNGQNGLVFTFMVNNRGFHQVGNPNVPSYGSVYGNSLTNPQHAYNRYSDPRIEDEGSVVTHKIFYKLPDNAMPESSLGAVPGGSTWLRVPEKDLNVDEIIVEGADGSKDKLGTKGAYIKFNNESGGDYYITIRPKADSNVIFPEREITGPSSIGENRIYWDGKDGDDNFLPAGLADVEVELKLRGAEVHFPYIDVEQNLYGIIVELLETDLSSVRSDIVYWDDRNIDRTVSGNKPNPINASHTVVPNGISSNINGHKWSSTATSGTWGDEVGLDTWTFIEGNSLTVDFEVDVKVADLYTEIESYLINGESSESSVHIDDKITYTVKVGNDGPSNVEDAPFSFILPPGFEVMGSPSFDGKECGVESMKIEYDQESHKYVSALNLPSRCEVTYTFTAEITNNSDPDNTKAYSTIMRPNDVTDPDATNISDPTKPKYTGSDYNNYDANFYYLPKDPFFEVTYNGKGGESNNISKKEITLERISDLEIIKNSDPVENVDVGQEITFKLTVNNNGPHNAINVVVTDSVPNGYEDITTISNDGVNNDGIITWNISALANGASLELSFNAKAKTEGEHLNTANVETTDPNTVDPNPDNNKDSHNPVKMLNTTNAVDDFFETGKNTPVSGNVLENDYDVEGDIQSVIPVTDMTTEKGGKVTINADGTFTYTPPSGGFSDYDTFKYTVCDNGTPQACDEAEVEIAVGICYEQIEGKSVFEWEYNEGEYTNGTILEHTYEAFAADYGFVVDLFDIDNSFNMEINGTKLAIKEIQFERNVSGLPQNVKFADNDEYSSKDNSSFTGDVNHIWNIKGESGKPIIRIRISPTGKVTLFGSKVSSSDENYQLYPLKLYDDNEFNIITMKVDGIEKNEIKVTQLVQGATVLKGEVYGAQRVECPNYWYGYDVSNEWADNSNWTDNYVPANYEDIVFATATNNSGSIMGLSGPGAGKGEAKQDLHLDDQNRIIKDLINKSDKNLIVTLENQLIIDGIVHGDNTGGIVVKADSVKATGTIVFNHPENNDNVQASVEFYNKAYECANCGYFRKSWQYFGIPVSESGFPYLTPKMETINEWMENVNGNKWVNVAENTKLHAFRGYEMTNSSATKPNNIYEFTGKLNVGDATISLSKTGGVNYSGMNLIANSFTAAIPISADAISYSDNSWDGQVYLFNAGTRDQWRKLNGGTVTHDTQSGQYKAVPLELAGQAGLNDRIPSMHTFMVNAPSTGTMTLKYDKLVKNELVDGMAWRSAKVEKREIPHIVLDVIGSNSADRVWLFEHAGTTRGFDAGWDGVKMPEKDIVQLYVAGEDNAENYQVATVPQMIGTSFGMQPDVNESYTLSVAVSADVEARGLYLRDMLTGRSYALKNGAEYKVQGSAKSDNRFKVVDTMLDESKLGDNPLIDIYVVDNQVVVANNSDEDCTVTLYDAAGKLVGKRAAARNSTVYMSNVGRVAGGVYVVKVAGTQQVNETKRVVVK